MSNISKRRREGSRSKIKSVGDHKEFLKRITKTLYYGQLPTLPCLSLPVTEISCDMWSEAQRGRSLRRLHADAAADIARQACVSPCALVLAVLYLERLNACNPDYLATAPPQELFLVSLMVGNKFLQDDGEDDEVICSEWAESGGIDLKQLNKLEMEFLNAIDWNIFVSEKSFEACLSWLERQVAVRQARLRGFFTYADLAAACDGARAAELLWAAARACVAPALGCVAGLVAVVASALVLSPAWLPAPQPAARPAALASPAALGARALRPAPAAFAHNDTAELAADLLAADMEATEKLKCCTRWMQYRERAAPAPTRTWYDAIVDYDWKLEPWWSKTSLLNWLYRSSLVDPMQRWLERVNEYADLLQRELVYGVKRSSVADEARCDRSATGRARPRGHCARRWLDLSKLGAVLATLSDR